MRNQSKKQNSPQNISVQKNQASSAYINDFSLEKSQQKEKFQASQIFQDQQYVQLKQLSQEKSKLDLTKDDLQYFGNGIKKKQWTEKEDRILLKCAQKYDCDWDKVVEKLSGRNKKMCYSRYQRIKLQAKSLWKSQENRQIKKLFQKEKLSWRQISFYFPNRTCKQIREHYMGYLKTQANSNDWTIEQDLKLIDLFNQYGTKWKKMNQNQIKNRYYGRLLKLQERKKQIKQDIDKE